MKLMENIFNPPTESLVSIFYLSKRKLTFNLPRNTFSFFVLKFYPKYIIKKKLKKFIFTLRDLMILQ